MSEITEPKMAKELKAITYELEMDCESGASEECTGGHGWSYGFREDQDGYICCAPCGEHIVEMAEPGTWARENREMPSAREWAQMELHNAVYTGQNMGHMGLVSSTEIIAKAYKSLGYTGEQVSSAILSAFKELKEAE